MSLQFYWQIAAYSFNLFAACMCCHGEIVVRRPAPKELTHFYLYIAAGGALGGCIIALAAPMFFNDFHEYPLETLQLLSCCWFAAALPRSNDWSNNKAKNGSWYLAWQQLLDLPAWWHRCRRYRVICKIEVVRHWQPLGISTGWSKWKKWYGSTLKHKNIVSLLNIMG